METGLTLFLSVVSRIICCTLPSNSAVQYLHWKLCLLIDISFQCHGCSWVKDLTRSIDGVVHCQTGISSLACWMCSSFMHWMFLITGISHWTWVICSWKSDVLYENANWEPISHYFKWDSINPKPPTSCLQHN